MKQENQSITLEIDKQAVLQALSGSVHNRVLLCRDYTLGKEAYRETVEVDGTYLGGGRVKLTLSRELRVVPPAVGPVPDA